MCQIQSPTSVTILVPRASLRRATPGKLLWKIPATPASPSNSAYAFCLCQVFRRHVYRLCLMWSGETEQALSVWFSNQGFSSHSNIFDSNNDPTGRSWLVTWADARDTWKNPGSCVLLVTQAILWARTRVPILRFLLLGSQGISVWSQIQGPVLSVLWRQVLMLYPEVGAESVSDACFTKRQL